MIEREPRWFEVVFKGVLIGMANVIPGLSGGTVALLTGLYSHLTEAVGNFFLVSWKKRWSYLRFLSFVVAGAIVGIWLFAKMLTRLYESYPEPVGFFFLGLVAATLPALLKDLPREERASKRGWVLFLIGFLITFSLGFIKQKMGVAGEEEGFSSLFTPITTVRDGLFLFFVGVVASATMIIPGISGAFILLLLGVYYRILAFVDQYYLLGIFVVGLGAVVGIVLFAKILNFLLVRYQTLSVFFITGLIVASLSILYPGITVTVKSIVVDFLALSAGGFLVFRFAHLR